MVEYEFEWDKFENKIELNHLRPELRPELKLVLEFFKDLSICRTYGLTANPLQVSEIKAYLDLQEVKGLEERLELFRLIKIVDNCWLKKNNG